MCRFILPRPFPLSICPYRMASTFRSKSVPPMQSRIFSAFASRPRFPPPIPLSTLPPRGTSRRSLRNAASPADLIPIHFALSPLPATLLSRLAANRVTNDRGWIVLLLFYRSSGLGDASLQQVSFDGHFLMREQIDLCFESLVSGKSNLDAVFPGADEHAVPHAAEFSDGSGESVIHKNRSPVWSDF